MFQSRFRFIGCEDCVGIHNHSFFVWDINMAAVTSSSRENDVLDGFNNFFGSIWLKGQSSNNNNNNDNNNKFIKSLSNGYEIWLKFI